MFKIGVSGIDTAIKSFERMQKQIKFGTAKALTRTAKRIQEAEQKEIENSFDKPVGFTKRAVGIEPATVQKLEARVFIKDHQAKYLLPQIMGGGRSVKKFESRFNGGHWVPGPGVKLNVAGNIPLATIKQIAMQLQLSGNKSGLFQKVFIGRPKNQPSKPFAIWAQDKKGKLVPMLIRLEHQPTYRKRFDFYGVAERMAYRVLSEELDRATKEAWQDSGERAAKRFVRGLF